MFCNLKNTIKINEIFSQITDSIDISLLHNIYYEPENKILKTNSFPMTLKIKIKQNI